MSVWPHLIWWDAFKNSQSKGNEWHTHRVMWKERHDAVWAWMLCQEQVSRAGTSNYITSIMWDVITCPYPWYMLRFCQNTTQSLHMLAGCRSLTAKYQTSITASKWTVLWISSLSGMSEDITSIAKVKDDNNKYHIPVANHFHCLFACFLFVLISAAFPSAGNLRGR